MDITIKLSDLGLILLWIALLVLLFYLILVLKRFYETMKTVQDVISSNKDNIEKTLKEIPSIVKNVDEITSEVSHDVKAVRGTIDNLTSKGEIASAAIGNTDFFSGLTSMLQSFIFLKDLSQKIFTKKKRVN